MMLEDLLLAAAVGIVLLMVGAPIVRLIQRAPWRPRDPLAEAHERLRIAQREAEAERVNREAEKIYQQLYAETLPQGDTAGARVATDDGARAPDESTEKEERNGKR